MEVYRDEYASLPKPRHCAEKEGFPGVILPRTLFFDKSLGPRPGKRIGHSAAVPVLILRQNPLDVYRLSSNHLRKI